MEKNISIFDEEFMKNYDKNNNVGYILEVDVQYPKHLHDLQISVPF